MKFLGTLVFAASLAQAYPKTHTSSRALYFLDSDPQGASIVSFNVAEDGSLGEPYRTSTGGKGLIANDMNGTVMTDPLFSQDSVIVRGNRLFTVNAGSNTLACFHIPEHDPAHPVLIEEPINTVGNVPNTVAYSKKNNIACVANTGSKPGVQCFSVSDCGRVDPLGNFKPLPVMNQTAPPLGPPNTVSDILFNPSETALFVTIKGNGMDDGYVFAYKVWDGKVSEEPVKSRPMGLPVAFSMSFISDSSAVITTPGYGAAFVSIADDLSVTLNTMATIDNQVATCWSVFSEEFGSVYLLDGGVANITTLDPESNAIGSTIPGYQDGMGNFDGVISGSMLYVLQGTPSISIFDLKDRAKGPQVVDLTALGKRASWTGMAIYSP
jgi:hypothetical protein